MSSRIANVITFATTTCFTTLAVAAFCLAPAAAASSTAASAGATPRAVYEDYGCVACHGDSGKGGCDLRQANTSFPTDAGLRAFIDDPATTHPGSKMPAYRDVISEGDYPALLAHVRRLSREAQPRE